METARGLIPVDMAGMLALHGIFTLVTRHGLEYPRFYERLYQLLTPAAFQVRSFGLVSYSKSASTATAVHNPTSRADAAG